MLHVKFEENGISVSDFAAKEFVKNYFEECYEEIFSIEITETLSISTYRLLQEICLYCLENLSGDVNKYIRFYFSGEEIIFEERKGLNIPSDCYNFFVSTEHKLKDIRIKEERRIENELIAIELAKKKAQARKSTYTSDGRIRNEYTWDKDDDELIQFIENNKNLSLKDRKEIAFLKRKERFWSDYNKYKDGW